MCNITEDCTNYYFCAYSICIQSCLALNLSIIIDRAIESPRHGKHMVSGMNYRDKNMLKLAMVKLFNSEFIRYDLKCSSLFRFMKMKNIKLQVY